LSKSEFSGLEHFLNVRDVHSEHSKILGILIQTARIGHCY